MDLHELRPKCMNLSEIRLHLPHTIAFIGTPARGALNNGTRPHEGYTHDPLFLHRIRVA